MNSNALTARLGRLTLPVKLAVACLFAALLPVSAALLVLNEEWEDNAIEDTQQMLAIRADDRERLLASHIGYFQRVAAGLAEADVIQDYLWALRRGDRTRASEVGATAFSFVQSMQAAEWGDTHHIFLTDSDGNVVLSPPHDEQDLPFYLPHIVGVDQINRAGSHLGHFIGNRSFFRQALTEPVVSPFYGFEERDHYHQLVLNPVFGPAGEPLGTVVIEIAIDAVTALMQEGITVGQSGRVFLATMDGQPVVHSRSEPIERIDSEGLSAAIAVGTETRGRFTRPDGTEVFGVYAPSTVYPWVVCIEIDSAEIMAPIWTQRRKALTIAVLLAMALGVVGVGIGLHFGLPLRRLAADADCIAHGSLEHAIHVTHAKDEIGRLQESIETMRVRLREQIRMLDERIEQRTLELAQANAAMAATQERFELALRGSRDAIFDWDLMSGSVFYSDRWAELLGTTESEVWPTIETLLSRVVPEDLPQVEAYIDKLTDGSDDTTELESEFRITRDDGSHVWVLCRAATVRDTGGRPRRVAGSLADITKLKDAETGLRQLVETDHLTGLANRVQLLSRLTTELKRCKRTGEICAVLFFDFDRFKVINDSLGHEVGDKLLCSIADRLRSNMRDIDLAARLGGDEFVVLLTALTNTDDAQRVAEQLLDVCAQPHELEGHRVVSTASIGLATSVHGYTDASDMLRDADAAMYQAKASGRGRVTVFDQKMHQAALERLSLEEDLRGAIERDELSIVFQPIVCLDTGRVEGAETLLRWLRNSEHPVSPAVFIPIAEEAGLIGDIGYWVLNAACARLADWKARKVVSDKFTLSVNVSKPQLLDPSFCRRVCSTIESHGLSVADIKLEVTETTIVDNRSEVSAVLQSLRDMKIKVVMDDFGTGHSSLSGLHTLPIDELKIDRSFIAQADLNRKLIAITSSIVALADHLSLRTVGEGIETPEHLATLQSIGCHSGQGYFFSKPVSAEQFETLFGRGTKREAA